MKLWVLVYLIDELEIFLTPSGAHSNHVKDALKFETEEGAIKHLDSVKSLLAFSPALREFEFKE